MSFNLFMLAAGIGVLVALAFALGPVFLSGDNRRSRLRAEIRALEAKKDSMDPEAYRSRRTALAEDLINAESRTTTFPVALVVVLALAVPLATFFMYQVVGTPEGLEVTDERTQSINQSLARLARRLERDPTDGEGWMLLGLSYKQMEQWSSAEQALRRSLIEEPENAHARVELAETLMFAAGQTTMPEESVELLEQAVEDDPTSQKGLWLLGIGEFQHGRYRQALDWWERLDNLLEDGSVRQSVREQMARARSRLGEDPVAAPSPDEDATAIQVSVEVAPGLVDSISGEEVLFVYARAANGPAMPLAIQRATAAGLPMEVYLDDSLAMAEGMALSDVEQVEIVARISASGEAVPATGDLQGISPVIDLESGQVVEARVVIDSRIE